MTGAPMPPGCDAVLPAEWVETRRPQRTDDRSSALSPPSRPARTSAGAAKTSSAGTDAARAGPRAAPAGPRRAQLDRRRATSRSSAGRASGWSITGNELLPSGSQPHGYRIADANGPMLAALVERDGGDRRFPRSGAATSAMRSSTALQRRRRRRHRVRRLERRHRGPRADACRAARRAGRPRHRDAAEQSDRPGRIGDRLVFLLPGNPVSCLCAYDFFAGRAIRALGGRAEDVAVPLRARAGWRARSARRSDGSTTPACRLVDGARRAARGRRRVGALVDDARRRLRHRRRRQRRLRCRQPTWTVWLYA